MKLTKLRKRVARLHELHRQLIQRAKSSHVDAMKHTDTRNSLINKLKLDENAWKLRLVLDELKKAKLELGAGVQRKRGQARLDKWKTEFVSRNLLESGSNRGKA